MSKITTEDCKDFLISHFKSQGTQTVAKDWKRTSKYKQDDLVHRDFSHPELGIVIVVEDSNGLSIAGNAPVKTTQSKNEYIQKDFTAQEKKAAKELLAQYIKRDYDSDDQEDNVEELMISDKWVEFQHALPSQFYFCFPDDTYSNHKDNVTKGIDSLMKVEEEYSSGTFNVMFLDKSGSDIDLYANDSLKNGVLPEWTSFVDEYHLELTDDAPEMTVREWFKMLLQMGFEYKDDDCLFSKELNKIKPVKSFTANKEKDKSLTKDGTLKAIFKRDDMVGLKSLLDSGLDVNMKLSGGDHVLLQAYKDNADNCVDILLARGADIWLKTNGDYCVAAQMIGSRYSSDEKTKTAELSFLLGHMGKQLPTDNLFGKISMLFSNSTYSSQSKPQFELLYKFVSKVLTEKEANQVILNHMEGVSRLNPALLINIIRKSDEDDYKAGLVNNIGSAYIVTWALGHRKTDITKEMVEGTTVVEHLQKEIKALKERIDDSKKGFMLVFVNRDGTQEYEIDRFINSYNAKNKLLATIEKLGGNNNKPKI
jgi:hypothetical protein